jgi:hypothetical protein
MGNVGTFMPMVRSVSRADSQPDGWDATELLKTTSGSFATRELKVEDGELARNPDWETAGPINLAVAATYAVPKSDDDAGAGEDEAAPGEEIRPPDDEEKQGRVVVVGTSRFTRNYSIGLGGNLDLLLNMVSWLTSDEDLISIRPKDPKSTPMDISASGMRNIFYGLVLGLPLVIIIAGVRTWWVRR